MKFVSHRLFERIFKTVTELSFLLEKITRHVFVKTIYHRKYLKKILQLL